MNSPKIITVTGTKGKTTVVSVVAEAIQLLDYSVMHVTTNGHYLNGVQKSTLADSKLIWGLKTPTLLPGRYLCEFTNKQTQGTKSNIGVLEATFDCSRRGLGYYRHDVGVLLNVFNDHIDPNGVVKNRAELAQAKSFVFSKVKEDGSIVFNADDAYVCGVLTEVSYSTVTMLPCGLTFTYFDVGKHLNMGGDAVTIQQGRVVLLKANETVEVLDLKDIDWTYGGSYEPSVWNIMHSFASLYAATKDTVSIPELAAALRQTHMQQDNGRLVVMDAPNGVKIIADYAHEKQSLEALAQLGRTFVAKQGQLWGVVRLSHERPDEAIRSTAEDMSRLFDGLIVYDKIDGYWRHAEKTKIKRYEQVEGRTSQIVYDAARRHTANVERIVREDYAIMRAAERAVEGDVVIVIVNDNARRSVDHIKKAFGIH